MNNLNIRNDIQSLRGLSVILIFLFHFDQVFFKYLYVGVDIFFVISGYVITSSISNSIKNNNFDIFKYFLRRIKRIYPGLIFFLIIFNIIFFLFISFNDGEYFEIIFSTISSFLGISNFYYTFTPNLDYFDDKLKWLQHTWSLSNEIQFYILIGIIFSLITKIFNLKKNKNIIVTILILISLVSIYFFIFGSSKLLSDYYSSFSRFWEFFLGSLAYLLNFEKFKVKKISFNLLIFAFIFLLLLTNFIFLNINYRFIILGSVTFIFFTIFFSDKKNLSSIHKIFIYYGNLSFSFFLWHLPIISFLKIYTDNGLISFTLSFLITSIISHISYRYVEIKFNKKNEIDKNFIFILKPLSFLSIFFIIFILKNNLFLDKTRNFLYQNVINFYPIMRSINIPGIDDNINDNWILPYDQCRNDYENFSFSRGVNCIIEKDKQNLFFISGNSFGDHIVPAFSMLDNNLSVYKSRFESCYINFSDNTCVNKSKVIIDSFKLISKDFKNSYFIISLKGGNISLKKFQKILKYLPSKTKILFIYPHPSFKTIADFSLFNEYKEQRDQDFKKLNFLKKDYDLSIFDTYSILCANEKCDKNTYGSFFIDGHHFKISTNKIISKKLDKIFF